MYRARGAESTQSPPARDTNQRMSASPQAASARSQLPTPKAPVSTERTPAPPKTEQPPAPPHTSTTPGQGGEASAAANAPQATATPSSAKPESPPPTFPIPAGGLRHEVQGLLVNMLAGNLLDETDTPIPRPRVAEVKPVAPVVVEPSQMDPETAQRLLTDGTTMESMGAFLLFNPAIGSERRGK